MRAEAAVVFFSYDHLRRGGGWVPCSLLLAWWPQ